MKEQDFAILFSRNLNKYLEQNEMNQQDLLRALNQRGVSVVASSVSYWCSGKKIPRMDKIDAICSILHINRSDLIEDKPVASERQYYLNDETAAMAQELFENPDTRMLFDAARGARPEDLRMAAEMLKRFKETNSDT